MPNVEDMSLRVVVYGQGEQIVADRIFEDVDALVYAEKRRLFSNRVKEAGLHLRKTCWSCGRDLRKPSKAPRALCAECATSGDGAFS